jgi:putative ABC transport system ATP-binding protein
MALLQKLNTQRMTIVMVTHETDIAAFASRIVTFRDGKIISDVKNTPANAQTQLSTSMAEVQ